MVSLRLVVARNLIVRLKGTVTYSTSSSKVGVLAVGRIGCRTVHLNEALCGLLQCHHSHSAGSVQAPDLVQNQKRLQPRQLAFSLSANQIIFPKISFLFSAGGSLVEPRPLPDAKKDPRQSESRVYNRDLSFIRRLKTPSVSHWGMA